MEIQIVISIFLTPFHCVSGELSSMEINITEKRMGIRMAFQENLVVWKCLPDREVEYVKIFVSGELSSMEINHCHLIFSVK